MEALSESPKVLSRLKILKLLRYENHFTEDQCKIKEISRENFKKLISAINELTEKNRISLEIVCLEDSYFDDDYFESFFEKKVKMEADEYKAA